MLNEKISYRLMTRDDVSQNGATFIGWFHEAHVFSFPEDKYDITDSEKRYEALLDYLDSGKASIMGAFDEEHLLGFIWFFEISKGRGHINEVIVGPDFRSRGIGTVLMSEVINYLEYHSIDEVELHVTSTNKRAVELYKKLGFVTERILMVKK